VWGFDLPADMPGAQKIPHEALRAKYGDFFFTSTIAWMMAMAIECMIASDEEDQHYIGLWGVDMAATEEYGYQRAGCQFFAQVAQGLGIQVYVPPESDLLTPPPLYGLFESTHRGIKLTARQGELTSRMAVAQANKQKADQEVMFIQGAIDDMQYHMNNWLFDDRGGMAANFGDIFRRKEPAPDDE
jgi:hypothetical protein